MLSDSGVQWLATCVDGTGPSAYLLIVPDFAAAEIKVTKQVALAHAAGLQVHPYTFRRERDEMPPFAKNCDDFQRIFFV